MTLWHGRLSGGTADVVMDYSVSLDVDRRLARDDLVGSRAHVRGLGRGGLLSEEEVAVLLDTLDRVEAELDAGTFAFVPDDEDIHTAVERRVTELAGDVGAKLHTGRSRNDQVATDLRLYAKRELTSLAAEIIGLQDVLATRAKEAGDTAAPPAGPASPAPCRSRASPSPPVQPLRHQPSAPRVPLERLTAPLPRLENPARLDLCPLTVCHRRHRVTADNQPVTTPLAVRLRSNSLSDKLFDRLNIGGSTGCPSAVGRHDDLAPAAPGDAATFSPAAFRA